MKAEEPSLSYRQWQTGAAEGDLLSVPFKLIQHWLDGSPVINLSAHYLRSKGRDQLAVTALAAPAGLDGSALWSWLRQHKVPCFDLGAAIDLATHIEPKPWGREIWYTGVEERGVCGYCSDGAHVPIPWLRAALPDDDSSRDLVLLKILDPLSEPVRGDLYFELHRQKREVYVVTHIDPDAWPDGTGYIRFGFDQLLRAAYPDDEGFRAAYLQAVEDYEAVRRALDDAPPANGTQLQALEDREEALRHAMDNFTHKRPLQLGDVVKVPLHTPHALQHGVRTVEFQTPVYERLILSFGQKVLTQGHWDTVAALDVAELDTPEPEVFQQLAIAAGSRSERIVDFDDFEVWRVSLEAGAEWAMPSLRAYALTMVVAGEVAIGGGRYGPEQACYLPAGVSGPASNPGVAGDAVFLFAMPKF